MNEQNQYPGQRFRAAIPFNNMAVSAQRLPSDVCFEVETSFQKVIVKSALRARNLNSRLKTKPGNKKNKINSWFGSIIQV
jgi:hypothetical protein